jgi:hypothetical protein
MAMRMSMRMLAGVVNVGCSVFYGAPDLRPATSIRGVHVKGHRQMDRPIEHQA